MGGKGREGRPSQVAWKGQQQQQQKASGAQLLGGSVDTGHARLAGRNAHLAFTSLSPTPCNSQLVDKSNDLSMASQLFYKQAKKANSCCKFM